MSVIIPYPDFAADGGQFVNAAQLDANFAALATAIGAGAQPYNTLADLQAAHIDSHVQSVVNLGRNAIGDGGGSQWIRTSSIVGRGLYFTDAGGFKWVSISQWMTFGMFNMFGTTTDCAPACGLLQAELVWRALNNSTPWVRSPANIQYPIYPTPPASQTRLLDFTAIGLADSSIKIAMNGSAFRCRSDLLTGRVIVYGVLFRDAYKPDVEVSFIQDIATNDSTIVANQPGTVLGGPNFNGGIWSIFNQDTIIQPKFSVNSNGLGGVVYARSTNSANPLTPDQMAKDGEHNIVGENLFYSYNARNNGNNMVGTISVRNGGRAWFNYNNYGSEWIVESVNHFGGFDDVLITCYANALSAYDSGTCNHTVKYSRWQDMSGPADDSSVYYVMDQQQASPVAGTLVNNRVEVNGDYLNMVDPGNFQIFDKRNTFPGGTLGNPAHIVHGNVVTGSVRRWTNNTYNGNLLVGFSTEDWTNSRVSGTGFDNFTFLNSGSFLPNMSLDGRAFGDGQPFLTENTFVQANLVKTNPVSWMISPLAAFTANNYTVANNQLTADATFLQATYGTVQAMINAVFATNLNGFKATMIAGNGTIAESLIIPGRFLGSHGPYSVILEGGGSSVTQIAPPTGQNGLSVQSGAQLTLQNISVLSTGAGIPLAGEDESWTVNGGDLKFVNGSISQISMDGRGRLDLIAPAVCTVSGNSDSAIRGTNGGYIAIQGAGALAFDGTPVYSNGIFNLEVNSTLSLLSATFTGSVGGSSSAYSVGGNSVLFGASVVNAIPGAVVGTTHDGGVAYG